MPIFMAWRLCPRAVYLRPNFLLYIRVSGEIMTFARKSAGKFEQWGIVEAFLDMSDKVETWAEAEVLARQIKQEIKTKRDSPPP
jgi:DNA polymerase IV (DinB-like DNA polymerase)